MSITKRIDNITEIKPWQRTATPPAPKSVKIELSPRCNYRCGFCALRTREKQPRHDMDFDLFKKITADMRQCGVEEIGVFYLGESFMNVPLLVEAIEWCKKALKFPYVFLTTNGSLSTPDAVEQCMQAGLDSLKFSINSATEEQFAEIMDVKPALFWKALENVKQAAYVRAGGEVRFLSQNPRPRLYDCGLYASSIQYDGEQQTRMEALLDLHVRPYVDEHYWLPLYSMSRFAEAREAELGYKPIAGNQGRLGALRTPLPCWTAFTEGHVRADGGLSACCFDAGGQWQVGDLTHQSFMEAWNSIDFQVLRQAHIGGDVTGTICEGCLAYA